MKCPSLINVNHSSLQSRNPRKISFYLCQKTFLTFFSFLFHMSHLVDAICLMEVNLEKVIRNLYYFQPSTFPLNEEIQYLVLNCVPPSPISKPSLYCFSMLKYTGYAMFFEFSNNFYSVVILSNFLYPTLFFEFLTESYKLLTAKDNLEEYINELWKILQNWILTEDERISLQFPFDVRQKMLNNDKHFFEEFNPYLIFPDFDQFQSIWKALLIGAPVLVVCNDEQKLTDGVFAILSLIMPYKYEGSILIAFDEHDPRLKHASDYPVVGVLKSQKQFAQGKFAVIIEEGTVDKTQILDYNAMREDLFNQTRNQRIVHLYLMDRVLLVNPYNDVLEGPFVNDKLDEEMRPKTNCLSATELRQFERTETAIRWREKILFRDAFRNAFLSVPAEDALNGLSQSHLKHVKQFLEKQIIERKGDTHIVSIMKKHLKIINKKLKGTDTKSSN